MPAKKICVKMQYFDDVTLCVTPTKSEYAFITVKKGDKSKKSIAMTPKIVQEDFKLHSRAGIAMEDKRFAMQSYLEGIAEMDAETLNIMADSDVILKHVLHTINTL